MSQEGQNGVNASSMLEIIEKRQVTNREDTLWTYQWLRMTTAVFMFMQSKEKRCESLAAAKKENEI